MGKNSQPLLCSWGALRKQSTTARCRAPIKLSLEVHGLDTLPPGNSFSISQQEFKSNKKYFNIAAALETAELWCLEFLQDDSSASLSELLPDLAGGSCSSQPIDKPLNNTVPPLHLKAKAKLSQQHKATVKLNCSPSPSETLPSDKWHYQKLGTVDVHKYTKVSHLYIGFSS